MIAQLRYPRPFALAQLGAGHNVVESSAGTGKTFLLEHLFVDLIIGRGLSIDEILVVTFTEKATAELVLRLRKLLGELANLRPDHPKAIEAAGANPDDTWLVDDRARQRLIRALLAFDRANISTIHGFCQRILRENAFVQGRLFDESLIAEDAAVRSALREILRSHAGEAGPVARALRAWLDSDKPIAELEKLLCECAATGTTEVRPRFDEARLLEVVSEWPLVRADEAALTGLLKREKVRTQTAKACASRLVGLAEVIAAHRTDVLGLLGVGVGGETLLDALAFVQGRLPRASADPTLAGVAKSVSALAAAAVPLDAAVAATLLPLLRERAAADKRRAGTFDYADMLGLVGQALADESPVREPLLAALRRRYRVALIDEFQDTDDVQWSIFRRIFVDGGDGHSLTVIGDPKQAIYGFRGADVLAYLRAREGLLAAGAARVELACNYRSTADLIGAQNLIFADQAEFFRPESGIRYLTPVRCGNPDRVLEAPAPEDGAPVVVFRLAPKGKSPRAFDLQSTLQATIVRELRRLTGPACPLRLRGRSGGDKLHLRDIFVLTFTNNESRAMGQALGRAGIPFAFYKQGKLFESPEANEILQVLRAVSRPEQRGLRARAFLTGFFDLDLPAAAAALDPTVASQANLQLFAWAALARKGDIPSLFAALLDESGILRCEIFANSGERALTNTMHVFEILQSEWARTHATLPELVELLSGYIRGTRTPPGNESDLQRLETDKDAVQILTVHTAKGLEADIVLLYGGTGEPSSLPCQTFHERGARVLQVGKPDETTRQAVKREEADERSRVLYVALTRARFRLYLPYYPTQLKQFSGTYRQANDHLERILGPGLAKKNPLFAVRHEDDQAPADATAPETPASVPLSPNLLIAPDEPPDLAAIKRARGGFAVTSYSAVKRAHGESVPKPSADSDSGAELPHLDRTQGTDELPGGAKAGIFLHDVLAEVSLPDLAGRPAWTDWFARPGVKALLHKLARRHGRPAGEVEPSARLVHLAFTRDVRVGDVVVPGLAQADAVLREMEFHFPIPALLHPLLSQAPPLPFSPPWKIERGVVKGFVDLLFEYGGRVFVGDWKSDTLPAYTREVIAPHYRKNYEIQARIYTLAALRLCGIATAAELDRRFGGMFFCFLRGLGANEDHAGIHCVRPDWDTILAWERDMLEPRFWGIAS